MRRAGIVVAIVAIIIIAYVASAIWSVNSLLLAVRAGDGPAIVRQTDVPRLRNMLVAQIVDAYLDRIGGRPQLERLAVAAYGPTVADALVGKILDEGLARLLREGVVQDPAKPSSRITLAPLGALAPGEVFELASRIRPFKLIEFDLRLTPSTDPQIYTAARFRFDGIRWRLSGLTLPRAIAADIAAMIVEPARHS